MLNMVPGRQQMVYKVTLLTTYQETVTKRCFGDFVSKNDTR